MRDPYWHEHHQFGSGWWVFMVFLMVVLVAGVVALVFLVSRRVTSGTQPPAAPPTAFPGSYDVAVRVLAERFARGEIDEAEYRARLAVLRGASG